MPIYFQEETLDDTPHTTQDDTTSQAEEQATTDTSQAENPEGQATGRTSEEYEAEIRELRREAAKRRVELKELRQANLNKPNTTEDPENRIAALTAEVERLTLGRAKMDAATKFNVPVELLTGNDEDEIAGQAEALQKWVTGQVKEAVNNAVPHAPRVPGENTGRTKTGQNDWLRDVFTRRRYP